MWKYTSKWDSTQNIYLHCLFIEIEMKNVLIYIVVIIIIP